MPVNRNALIRYKTINKCLQNHYRQWTLEDLIEACSDALYDYEGIDKGVSKRTIQADIQLMRSDKLGYNAPIIVVDKKYYIYEDHDYSITNIPVTDQDLERLNETVEFLRQFKGFTHFKELDSMVQKLEDHVHAQKTDQDPVIDFEKNENLKGLEHLDSLYQSIIKRKAIQISYQSFKARQSSTFDFHPYLLKEFRNRWFVLGSKKEDGNLLNLALDRIIKIDKSDALYVPRPDFNASAYFQHTIGVSVLTNHPPSKVILFVTQKHAPYVLTKPFHPSQKLIDKNYYGITISLDVHHNFELEKDILGFGDGIKVIAPERLKRSIRERLSGGLDLYNTEISEPGLLTATRRLEHKGFSILKYIYTKREIRNIKRELHRHFKETNKHITDIKDLFKDIPSIKPLLFNQNLSKILKSICETPLLSEATYTERPNNSKEYLSWHQDFDFGKKENGNKQKSSFLVFIYLDDVDHKNGALGVVPGSHNKILSDAEIETIANNSIPYVCETPSGGLLLMKPLLLHAWQEPTSQMKRGVIKLGFG